MTKKKRRYRRQRKALQRPTSIKKYDGEYALLSGYLGKLVRVSISQPRS